MLHVVLLRKLDVLLEVLVHEVLCFLVILLIVLTRVARIEVQVITLGTVFGCLLKSLTVNYRL